MHGCMSLSGSPKHFSRLLPINGTMARISFAIVGLSALLLVAASSSQRYVLSFDLQRGDRVTQRRYRIDKIEWKLPRKRLEPFIRNGVVIHEERREASLIRVSVDRVTNGSAAVSGTEDT